mmetsp:Transcript_14317/g.20925  ORF Transcript_14317/g.20925 Transcript_14317/m.20925 type:complete len:111 (-) Transcript_14317:35-367(-)
MFRGFRLMRLPMRQFFTARPQYFRFMMRNFATSQADVESSVISQLKEIEGVDVEGVNSQAVFEDIGLDSLAQIEMFSALEEKFNISLSDEDTEGVKGVADLVKVIMTKLE